MNDNIFHKVKVVEIISETSSAKTFVLQPLHGWQPVYKTGQFITLVFTNTGKEKRRSYSLVSQPGEAVLRITVKRVVNGEYSRYMLDHIITGDELLTVGIAGFFTLPEEMPPHIKQLFFLAAGSGITPVYALIKTALEKWQDVSIILVYSNRNQEDVIFYSRLIALQEAYEARFRIEWLFSNSAQIHKARLSNYLLNILLKQYVPSPQQTLFYMCGPFDYMLMIQITLLIYGMPPQHLYKEQFSMLPRIVKPIPPDAGMHTAEIYIRGNSYHIQVQYPSTILHAAKEKNITLPYSCEAGRCGSCAATCTHGKIWMAYNEVLTDDEIQKGRVLVCQAYPVGGDVTIRFDV